MKNLDRRQKRMEKPFGNEPKHQHKGVKTTQKCRLGSQARLRGGGAALSVRSTELQTPNCPRGSFQACSETTFTHDSDKDEAGGTAKETKVKAEDDGTFWPCRQPKSKTCGRRGGKGPRMSRSKG